VEKVEKGRGRGAWGGKGGGTEEGGRRKRGRIREVDRDKGEVARAVEKEGRRGGMWEEWEEIREGEVQGRDRMGKRGYEEKICGGRRLEREDRKMCGMGGSRERGE